MTLTPGDLVRFKARKGLGHPCVTALHPHAATIQPARGGGASLTVPLCRVRPADLEDVAGMPHRVQFDPSGAGTLPALAAVVPRTTGGGPLLAVPKNAPPFRSAAYRTWMRMHRCCNRVCPTPEARIESHHAGSHGVGELACDSTCVPLCVLCHRAVTRSYAVPGLSRAETERLFDQVAVRLMAQWVVRVEAQTVVVPLLRLVAAVLLFLLLPAHAAAAQADPAPRPIGVGAVVLWGLGLVLLAWAALRRRPAPAPVLRPKPLSVPSDDDLLCIVHQREGGATLAEICERLWPFLPWTPTFEGEPSATTGAQAWPCHPPIATPADWVRDRMTVLSTRGAVRLVARTERNFTGSRWVACRPSGALLLGLGRSSSGALLVGLVLSMHAGCTADTLTWAGVALLALSCAGLGALVQGWRHWRAVRGVVEQHDRRIGRLESQARRSEKVPLASRRSLLALVFAPLALRPRAATAAAAAAVTTHRRTPEWVGAFGWVYFTVRLWQVDGSWRFSLHDLPGHEPSATTGETYPGREDAYGRACDLIEAAGYPVSPGFRTLRRGPDAWRAGSDMGCPVEYHRIGSMTRREVT